jgi:predicted metalloprotease with PDZ domain
MTRPPALLVAGLLLSLLGCRSAPVAPVPQPLAEALAWERADATGGAFLGLRTRENERGTLDALTIAPGARVTRVAEGSPAAAAGFRVGDVVLAWNRQAVADPEALGTLLAATEPGVEVRLEVLRDDTVFEVPCRTQARAGAAGEPVEELYHLDPARSLASWATGRGGAVLVASAPEGPLAASGVSVGDVVTHAGGLSARDLIQRLQGAEPGADVELTVRSGAGDARDVTVELFEPATRVTGANVPILLEYSADVDGRSTYFELLDLWILSLFRYEREGHERHYTLLSLLSFSTGVGELAE